MCCFKSLKNFEKLNNMVQVICSVAIHIIQTLPDDISREKEENKKKEKTDEKKDEQIDVKDSKESEDATKESLKEEKAETDEESEEPEKWDMTEKDRLLQFITKIFLMNFPSYMAYKHIFHSTLEELSQQETSALNNYCEISDPDVPLFLLRNVCFFCDSNGIGALRQCFEKATPETLPFNFAHLLISLIANLRLWMNIPTVMQYIVPLRSAVIRYMCKLSDKDLRMAGNRNMTELMWAAVKEPLETHFQFDKEGLDLAFKYFTCSTLTIRLAGIAQINNQINLYNESCNNESMMDAERFELVGHHLAQWLLDNKIIEHIFGPNLHVELIKQSQLILNLLAVEGKITNDHVDCIWAASQLKHCSKQVYDMLIPLIKNLDLQPVQYLLKLVTALEPTAHTESTLYLASALIKCVWNTCAETQQLALHQHGLHGNVPSQFTALQQDSDAVHAEVCKGKLEMSSSESIQVSDDEDQNKVRKKQARMPRKISKLPLQEQKHGHQGSCCHGNQEESDDDCQGHSEESEVDSEHERHIHHARRVPHHEQDTEGSESELEESESSEEEEEVIAEGDMIHKINQQRLLEARRHELAKAHHQMHHQCMPHQGPHASGSSEEEEEDLDSEEEELLKEAKHITMKQCCSQQSEESSDFEEALNEGKMSYQISQKILQKHHMNQKRKEMLQQATQMALQHPSPRVRRRRLARSQRGAPRGPQGGESQESGEDPTDTSTGEDRKPGLAHDSSHESETLAEALKRGQQAADRGLSKEEEAEIFDCTPYVQQVHAHQRRKIRQQHGDEYIEDIMSPDDGEGSNHSSRMSAKSEKNMADFEGEDFISDEELAQINGQFNQHQMHLSNLASMYHTHMPRAVIHHCPQQQKEPLVSRCSDAIFNKVCERGNTLLWDLVQEDTCHLLPEGLAMEAEKALCSLVCFSTDRKIKTKFIEACIENLAHHRSVVVSLRLLPKVFSSFQQYRSGADTHHITMWAEKELNLMSHFFIDLVHYTESVEKGSIQSNSMYSHKEEIQVRLLFLTCVFSTLVSPDSFRLNLEQVDTLWRCVALDKECSDDCLSWFLNQAKSKDHHALGLETFKHIFLEKMPQLKPECMSMIGLNLFQQLSQLTRIADTSSEQPLSEDKMCGIDQLWSVALRANNTDVSITAIQILNSYYINYGNGQLEKEEEFVQKCMESLTSALTDIEKNTENNLLVIQRGLVLLKNHLEAFRKRYAYHLRNWQIDGKGIRSHQRNIQEKQSAPLRITLQPAGMVEKTQLEMQSTDLLAELRAEVARWWEGLHKQQMQRHQSEGSHGNSVLSPILGAMLGDGPIRMITLGQELTVDMDEKSLQEMQFKDTQLVFVSVGSSRPSRKSDGTLPSSSLPCPVNDLIPVMLLIREPHFGKLFLLLEQLSKFDCDFIHMESQDRWGLHTKARILSRKVWELLMLLPTNQVMLDGFRSIIQDECDEQTVDWNALLDSQSPHKLMYSLQIVESLSRSPKNRRRSVMRSTCDSRTMSTDSELDGQEEELWSQKFITKGGLKHLLNIFKSGSLQAKEDEAWSQWNQECLAYLLRLISQFSVELSDAEAGHDDVFESYESPRKKMKRHKGASEKIIVPRLNQSTLSMLNIESVLQILMKILYDAAVPWYVVHYSLSFLVSWAYSCDEVKRALCLSPNFVEWLKRLTLQAPEPFVRREACMGLYRLCLGKTSDAKTGYALLIPMLTSMLSFLEEALAIKPQKTIEVEGLKEKEKEPQGPGCRDYFWLVSRFVDSISREDAKSDAENGINLNHLAKQVSQLAVDRPYYETRQGFEEDDGLIGILNLCASVIKHKPPYKTSPEGKKFLDEVFWFLFALPSPSKRYLPKCKSQTSRSSAYDLLVEFVKGSVENYHVLHMRMMQQHNKDSHASYLWDYWPHEDGRAKCGYVGLTNLGATCYMATCMQHLYMIPQARQSILHAECPKPNKYEGTLTELQKMFAYLQESERKAYNPRSFCKTYMMDKQPLNTGEQKDMTEFFTDLISKLEEMSTGMDCPHVSRTLEEFYTVRCQVTDMKNLYESLDEVTVKDMLEGDNMYTCSKCQKKVRAEKRACFKRLPRILCFNTMRYTFNMVTMMKEKVNTHFSFPLCLDMSQYMEKNLMGPDKLKDDDEEDKFLLETMTDDDDSDEYELIGVTVHTGTADGGHYYSFIRDRLHSLENGQDRWYVPCYSVQIHVSVNDAEVKPFDPSQIATECFGGEMTSKTYDSVTDKFMDFSFEKTNSAYMLFYERCPKREKDGCTKRLHPEPHHKFNFELPKDLGDIHMADLCLHPNYLTERTPESQVPLKAAQLSTSFVLETLIHSKEKPTMLQWIELLTKQFNSCPAACEWFLDHMAESDWWPQQILIKCPNQMVRQMFQRLLIHVITQLRPAHFDLYLQPIVESEDGEIDVFELGSKSCVTRFIKKMLSILDHGVRPHSKFLTEYFAFLLEFAKMGDEECLFLINVNAIATMVNFYLGQKQQETYVEIPSDDEEEEVITITEETYKPLSLEKMVTLIALLVEKSRGEDNQLHLSDKDYSAIVGGKGFPFLYNQIRDAINIRQTCNLIFSLSRWHEQLAITLVQMVFGAIKKLNIEHSQPFFKLMSMLVEFGGGPPGLPSFTQYVLQKFWDLTKCCPQPCLEWMASQVTRNRLASQWVLTHMETWVEPYLLAHSNARVRNAAACLLTSLVPSNHFRQTFRATRSILSPHKEMSMTTEAVVVLHQIYKYLLSLMSRARLYADAQTHGTTKLISYFAVLTFCLISRTEKLMFNRYFLELWNLFQPKLCEPQISMHHNKQALMFFWYQVCQECPENIKSIVTNPHVCKQIAYNYILADHDDQDVVMFNRVMLPSYYGLLRMCCQQSRSFTRQLAQHQNIQWAFKNITPHPGQYPAAVEELFKMMKLMSTKYQDSTEEEIQNINHFKRTTVMQFLGFLDARSGWQTLISVLKILTDSFDDRLLLLFNNGLQMITEAFNTLHVMYHEATACHVTGDIVDLLSILLPMLKVARNCHEKKGATAVEVNSILQSWKERVEFVKKMLTLLNSYTPPEIRRIAIDVLREMVLTYQSECVAVIVPILTQSHLSFQDNTLPVSSPGPYFPRRGQKPITAKSNIRPPRPMFNMMLHSNQIEATKGVDESYDSALQEFFHPYHAFVDLLCRVAVNHQSLSEPIITLSAMVAIEGVPLHLPFFAKLWYEIYQSEVDRNCIKILCNCSYFIEYVDSVLLDERLSLNNPHIYQFFCNFFPKVHQQVLSDQGRSHLDSLIASVTAEKAALENVKYEQELMSICHRINGDLRAMLLIFTVQPPKKLNNILIDSLHYILTVCREHQKQRSEFMAKQHRKRSGSMESQEDVTEAGDAETPSKRQKLSGDENMDARSTCSESSSSQGSVSDQHPHAESSQGQTSADKVKSGSRSDNENQNASPEECEVIEIAEDDGETSQNNSNNSSSDRKVGDTDGARKQEEVMETKTEENVDTKPAESANSKEDTTKATDSGKEINSESMEPQPGTSKAGVCVERPPCNTSQQSSSDTTTERQKEQEVGKDDSEQKSSKPERRRSREDSVKERRGSCEEASSSQQGSSSFLRGMPREKPTLIDIVAKHIESLFNIVERNQ
ncbi:hypothetical protein FSP39_016701 [Pinctada imbricata]|uniref:USP domain-containing protein n=1 Tax=Pinctada imbricata TaxID=66713 RepID=A0AA89BT67_PINIB|nr:hypothetical protein FSP39_016701 [Pinctada imbricata]